MNPVIPSTPVISSPDMNNTRLATQIVQNCAAHGSGTRMPTPADHASHARQALQGNTGLRQLMGACETVIQSASSALKSLRGTASKRSLADASGIEKLDLTHVAAPNDSASADSWARLIIGQATEHPSAAIALTAQQSAVLFARLQQSPGLINALPNNLLRHCLVDACSYTFLINLRPIRAQGTAKRPLPTPARISEACQITQTLLLKALNADSNCEDRLKKCLPPAVAQYLYRAALDSKPLWLGYQSRPLHTGVTPHGAILGLLEQAFTDKNHPNKKSRGLPTTASTDHLMARHKPDHYEALSTHIDRVVTDLKPAAAQSAAKSPANALACANRAALLGCADPDIYQFGVMVGRNPNRAASPTHLNGPTPPSP